MYLNVHSCFSFRYGVMRPEELLAEARAKGISTLALTDINNTSGILDFIRLAPGHGVRPLAGIDFRQGAQPRYIGIARNNQGFLELNRFLSTCLANGDGQAEIPERPPVFEHAVIIYPFGSIRPPQLRANEYIGVKASELNRFRFSGWEKHAERYLMLATATFRGKRDFNTHRLLRAIGNNTLLSKLPPNEQASGNEVLMSEEKLLQPFSDYPGLVTNTRRLLERCDISFEYHTPKNKKLFTSSMTEDVTLLRRLSLEGLKQRYAAPAPDIMQRLEKELELITRLGFSSYFLINHDIVNYARHKGYFHVGRGSGANSIVAYCLRITDVDPIDLDLYFERFMNEFRVNPPDFDIDFSWKDRDDVTRYIFERHGTTHTALLATYSTFQYRAVIRELGKVFGLPKAEIDSLIDRRRHPDTPDQITSLIYRYSGCIHDLPNHLSIHAGGVLISEEPIHYYTATSSPPKGFPLAQFSMLEAEDVGLYKFDILSQRGLGHIRDSVEVVKRNRGIDIDIHDIKAFKEDPAIRDHLREGRTMGCFYVESPAMRMLLKKLEAETYPALVAASSIIRPGVAQSGMMNEYIKRFRHPEKREYIHPVMEELMEETFGIMVYQEDVIKVAHHFAGMSLAEADVLRRGMSGKFRARDEFQKAQDKFIEGCRAKGYPEEITLEVWRQVESFAGYSFSKGHSASYAVESYQSMYLKAHYPLEFMVGVINNFGGFYRTEYYVHEARMCGANILAPCVNAGEYLACIKGKDLYLGFILIAGLDSRLGQQIETERAVNGPYRDLDDFIRRLSPGLEMLRLLIRIGAFRFTGKTKKELLWEMYALYSDRDQTPPAEELFQVKAAEYTLPPLTSRQLDDAYDELEILGFSLCSPFDLIDGPLPSEMRAADLPQHIGRNIRIVGYFVCDKITRTVKKDEMCFGCFLDRDGYFFDTTHFPQVFKRYPLTGRGCYLIEGKVAEEFGFPSIEVSRVGKLGVRNRMQEEEEARGRTGNSWFTQSAAEEQPAEERRERPL